MFPFWKSLQIRSAPSSTTIPTKQYIDNKMTRIPMAMPFKSQNMSQGSTLANAARSTERILGVAAIGTQGRTLPIYARSLP